MTRKRMNCPMSGLECHSCDGRCALCAERPVCVDCGEAWAEGDGARCCRCAHAAADAFADAAARDSLRACDSVEALRDWLERHSFDRDGRRVGPC